MTDGSSRGDAVNSGRSGDSGRSERSGDPIRISPPLVRERGDFGGSDGEIFVAIRDGMASRQLDEAARTPAVGGPSLDHAYGGRLNDTDIWNLVNHLRTFASGAAR